VPHLRHLHLCLLEVLLTRHKGPRPPSKLICRRDINIRAQAVADAGKQIYTNKLLLGGVLSNETDKLFEARGKIGEKK
jgi:hypothetical protein